MTATTSYKNMKITPEHYDLLRAAIIKAMADNPHVTVGVHKSNGLSTRRWRWDLFNFAQDSGYFKLGDGKGVSGIPLYEYLNDEHIDTALRRITNT